MKRMHLTAALLAVLLAACRAAPRRPGAHRGPGGNRRPDGCAHRAPRHPRRRRTRPPR